MNPSEASILFVCAGLEPGRDGVGDYVRILGDALAKLGWEVASLALNDPHVTVPTAGDRLLRLPATLPLARREVLAREFAESMGTTWISLQWVGFGFEKRGLPYRWGGLFERLFKGRRRHLFFHEIWLGEKPGVLFRHRLLGVLQRRLTCRLVRRWKPEVMHTSNRLYAEFLRQRGIEAGVLSLPGNIPRSVSAESPTPPGLWERAAGDGLRIALFGSLDAGWSPDPWFAALEAWAEARQVDVEVLILGASRGDLGTSARPDERSPFVRFEVRELGFLPAAEISVILETCDAGATTKSFQLLGKSGAFAALAEHGLPVMVLRSPREARFAVEPENWSTPVLNWEACREDERVGWLDRCLGGGLRGAPRDGVAAVAQALAAALASLR